MIYYVINQCVLYYGFEIGIRVNVEFPLLLNKCNAHRRLQKVVSFFFLNARQNIP